MRLASVIRIVQKISLKLSSDLLGRLAQLVLIVIAARLMTPREFGDYAFAAAVGFILGQLSDFGLQLSLLRTLSSTTSTSDAGRSLGETLLARVGLAFLTSALGLTMTAFLDRAPEVKLAIGGVVLALIWGSLADSFFQVFRAKGLIKYEVTISLGGRVVLVVIGAETLTLGLGFGGLALAHLVSALLTVAVSLIVVRWRIVSPLWPSSVRPMISALVTAFPIGLGIAGSLLYFKLDIVLLQWLRTPEEVGLYSAAYKLFEPNLIIPGAILAVTFPSLARAGAQMQRFMSVGARLYLSLGGLALVVTAVGYFVAPVLVPLLYGTAYLEAAGLLQVLVLAFVPMFVNYGLTHGFIALGRAWYNAAFSAGALVVNLGLNLLLIPTQGAHGAALATVLTEVTLLTLCCLGLAREMSRRKKALLASDFN